MKSASPVMPMSSFVPTDDANTLRRDAICTKCYHQPFAIMKIHEYQAKAILAKHGVPVPRGEVAFTPSEAREIAGRLGTGVVVVKAQIHAGGRGKGGGGQGAKSP